MAVSKKKKTSKTNSGSSSTTNKKKSSPSKKSTTKKTSTKKSSPSKKSTTKKTSTKKSSPSKKSTTKKASTKENETGNEIENIENDDLQEQDEKDTSQSRKNEIKVNTYIADDYKDENFDEEDSENNSGQEDDDLKNEEKSESEDDSENEDLGIDLGFEDVNERKKIDSQKKFYQELNKEFEQKHLEGDYEKSEEKDNYKQVKTKKPSVGLYRKRAFFFIFLTIILLVAIFYFTFSKLTVYISPSEEVVNNNVLLDVHNKDNNNINSTSLSGDVMALEIEDEGTYQSTGEEVIGEEIVGTVKIINNYSKDQPLVATTRLLSPNDKLFRITEAVTVPAGSSVEVEIYADEVSRDMAISPTTFTIPGLWAGLQDDIYAESEEGFVYKTKTEKYLTVSDVEKAQNDLEKKMIAEAKEIANSMFDDDYNILYDIDDSLDTYTTEAVVGDKLEQFDMQANTKVIVVAFLKDEARELARNKLDLLVPSNKEIKEFDESNLTYSLDNYNVKDGNATVKIRFSGLISMSDDNEIIDKKQLVNLNRQQIRKYLDTYPEIKNYTLKFKPAFLDKAPSLADRIEIKIENN